MLVSHPVSNGEGKGVLEHPFRYSLVNLRLIYATRPTSGCENND